MSVADVLVEDGGHLVQVLVLKAQTEKHCRAHATTQPTQGVTSLPRSDPLPTHFQGHERTWVIGGLPPLVEDVAGLLVGQ